MDPTPPPSGPRLPRLAPGTRCHWHAQILACNSCSKCHSPICTQCVRQTADGEILCRICGIDVPTTRAGDAPVPSHVRPPIVSTQLPSVPSPGPRRQAPPIYALKKCGWHPETQAVRGCDACPACVCDVCDFEVEGALHLCPVCVMSSGEELSGRRIKFVVGGYLSALVGTAAYAGILTGMFGHLPAIAAGFMVIAPAVAGVALSFSAIEKRLVNPPVIWVPAIWSSALLGLITVLSVLRIFK